MAIKLADCPPALHAAIMKQLEAEGRLLPVTTVKYAVATQMGGKWKVGPETENQKLVCGIVGKLQTQTPLAAHRAAQGNPTAVVVRLTRTTAPLGPLKAPAC